MADRVGTELGRQNIYTWLDSDTGSFIRVEADSCIPNVPPLNGVSDLNVRKITVSFAVNGCLDNGTRFPVMKGSMKTEAWTGGAVPDGDTSVVPKSPMVPGGEVNFSNDDVADTLISIVNNYLRPNGFLGASCQIV